MTDSFEGHKLPWKPMELVLKAVKFPAIGDGTFMTHIEDTLEHDDLDTDTVRDLIQQHTRAQLSLFLVCRDFASALVPRLQAHIKDITLHLEQLREKAQGTTRVLLRISLLRRRHELAL